MAAPSDEKAKIAHLLRRAGFGPRPGELDSYVSLGLVATTQQLLHPETVPDQLQDVMRAIGGDYLDFDNLESVKQWWLYRMVHTHRPLEEKLTLFWHNHFATANYKVNNPRAMWQQNELFRRDGLGSFRSLLQGVTRDPAMLIWLDGAQNQQGHPNENFGREIMELFTMGFGSGYTENDVQEGARAFTGWRYDGNAGRFLFDPYLHDDGSKTFLGHTGNFEADDVIEIIVRQPATARFLCTRLFKFFVHDQPDVKDLAPLEQVYFQSGYNIRAILQTIFTSSVFYSDAARYACIKSPVEFAVSTMRALDAPMLSVRDFPNATAAMGQDLFNPPNVAGWHQGRAWINSRTLLARVNFAIELANEMNARGTLQNLLADLAATGTAGMAATPPSAKTGGEAGGATMASPPTMEAAVPMVTTSTVPPESMSGPSPMDGMAVASSGHHRHNALELGPEQMVNALWEALMPGYRPSAATHNALLNYAADGAKAADWHWQTKLPGLVNLILAAPEYQLA